MGDVWCFGVRCCWCLYRHRYLPAHTDTVIYPPNDPGEHRAGVAGGFFCYLTVLLAEYFSFNFFEFCRKVLFNDEVFVANPRIF